MIVIGADTHKGSHALAAVDEGTGRVRGHREIEVDDAGHLAAVRWARSLDEERVWAIEDCRHVSLRLEQALLGAGEPVIRVAPQRMGASRKGEREPGKSDQIDALAIARAVVKDGVDRFPVAFLDERAMEIRLLHDHRGDLVAERTRTINRLRWHLVALCPELERSLKRKAFNHARVLDRVDRRLRNLPAGARARIARELIAQLRRLNRHLGELEAELAKLVAAHRPRLLAEQGCGALTAAHPAIPLGGELCAEQRNRARPVLLRPTHPAPPQPRRGPPAQPRAAHHRGHPRPVRPRHQEVPGTQKSRRQNHQGSAALPQTPPRTPFSPAARTAAHQPPTPQAARRPAADRDQDPNPERALHNALPEHDLKRVNNRK
jgi:transposase